GPASADGPGSGPVAPVVDSHQELVVWVGLAVGWGSVSGAADAWGSGPAGSLWSAASGGGKACPATGRVARRARAWYSGPCLRGSAYSFGLRVQYVPLVVPYQLAPRQSGSNGPSTPSYEVDPSVALLRFRAPG